MKKLLIFFIAVSLIEVSLLGYYFYLRGQTHKIVRENEVLGITLKRNSIRKPRIKLSPTPILLPTATPTPNFSTQSATLGWGIKSVSSMKETKDKICNQRTASFIYKWVAKAKELGANYVAVETPYDSPACGDSVAYTKLWVQAIRESGMNVWHRHMPTSFEGIYDAPKNIDADYLPLIESYIKNNSMLFAAGDIFTPIPEPQNGGIAGVSYCPQDKCYFKNAAHFNSWLRDAIDRSNAAFTTIGLQNKVKLGYYGFDGYITWGDNNPDWTGILEDTTIAKMGVLAIDHYPEAVGDTMENDLAELTAKYPHVPIVIGEWGTISGGDRQAQVRASMGAAKKVKNVVGFNYWHMGVGGNEALVNEDMSVNEHYDEVQYFYKN